MQLIFIWAEKLARGCGWFALCVGVGLGGVFGGFFQQGASFDIALTHQVLSQVLFGHLPTFFVSAFVLLRVSFQLSTDEQTRTEWTGGEQALAYAVGCAIVCVMTWTWFFLSTMLGFGLGLMQTLGGDAWPAWDAFWFDFDFHQLAHAAFRMSLMACALSLMTFVEISFMRTRRHQLAILMSRFMTVGMVMLVGIELLDITLT